ncbi:MAG: 2-C-methyl-D-erythritol 4-phosphate cytidylyltransferase [Chloroflexi bacterium]|nr:2-C-methyl-D-erythritol 4-phosphate cytidylyltransferase [Ktedonobacteraceae bacterium]MBV9021715.1 2-C-methyl-D-erythritol 4-phosphate cytidylyltransferase [Ktedonobacteraceae bacterium]MBV9707701.1 2-C-methyl-D-erythritol 4-phosphate cytidylyltransferase [Chloroflexota bacterium]
MRGAAAIILANEASGHNTLWSPLAGRVTLARTIDVFQASPLIETIILVTNAEHMAEVDMWCEYERWHKLVAVVAGGIGRQDAVRVGLDRLAHVNPVCRWVMIHDGARPFVTATLLEEGLKAGTAHLVVSAAVPVKDTIKEVQKGHIRATFDRSQLWTLQTPQVFSFPLLYQAHYSPFAQEDVADDVALLRRMGQRVTLYSGSYTNIKIMTQQDILLAEALLEGQIV